MLKLGVANDFFPYLENIRKGNLEKETYENLEKIAINHAIKNSKKRMTDKVVVLIYPFKFFDLSKDIKKNKSEEINKYFFNLESILKKRLGDYTLALFEDVISYASHSGKLAEGSLKDNEPRLFDNIILTKQNSIKPLNDPFLHSFFNKEIYIGGCYNGSYLSRAINIINCKAKSIYAIQDLTIEDPENSYINILSKKVYDWNDDLIKSIPLKKFINQNLE